ncbi:MAG: hypothetical protein ACTHXA_03330 [Gulosibacter sp.]|uniref:hypothetical protein n=1 Tax=Gulosibacter sp. TaxID=2817531 RepID=UPI003F93DFA0
MNKIRTLSLALLGTAALVLTGCASDTEPATTDETEPDTAITDAATVETTESAPDGAAPSEDAEEPEYGSPGGGEAEGELPDDWEDLVILEVNDLTIMCEDWCISPEQDQFAAADWDAMTDGESLYQFRVYEGEALDLEHVTPESDSWLAWEDVISELGDGQYIEVQPIVMDVDSAVCSGSECEAAGETNTTEGIRLLYDVTGGEAVYVGITGTH